MVEIQPPQIEIEREIEREGDGKFPASVPGCRE